VAFRRTLLVLVALVFISCTRRSQFIEREVHLGEHTYKYRVWLPQHFTKLHHWPVVLYLHGSGERGSDNQQQVSEGLGPAVERFGERYRVIAVFPQCESEQEWYGEMESMAMTELDNTIREFHGDRARIYITGISMGGAGATSSASSAPAWPRTPADRGRRQAEAGEAPERPRFAPPVSGSNGPCSAFPTASAPACSTSTES